MKYYIVMEKKIYNKPFMVREQFVPQNYIAACNVFIPAENVGRDFWVDLVHSNGNSYNYSIGPDGIADEQNVEHCLQGSTAPTNVYFHNVWYQNMTLYKKEVTSHDSGRTRYSDTHYFTPITGFTNVAIYVGSGRRMWIFNGNDGLKPENPEFYPTVNKTYS